MMNNDNRTLLKANSIQVGNCTVENLEKLDCGGTCIVYKGEYNNQAVIVKEFNPVSLNLQREENSDELIIPEEKKEVFDILKDHFINGSHVFQWYASNSRNYTTAPIIGEGETNNTYYYIVDIENGGEPLKRLSDTRADISLVKACKIMRGVCTVISNIHQNGELYLDLKPGNIWYDDPENDDNTYIRLFDFDTAVKAEEVTSDRFISRGSRGYAANELTNYEKGKIGYRTDVYSIGMVFYWLLTGNSPVSADRILNDDSWMDEPGCLIKINKSDDDKTNREIKKAIYEILNELLSDKNRFRDEYNTNTSVRDVVRTKFGILKTKLTGANLNPAPKIKSDLVHDFDYFMNLRVAKGNYRPRYMTDKMLTFVAKNDKVKRDIKKTDLSVDKDTISLIKEFEMFMTYKIIASDNRNDDEVANILSIIDEDNVPDRWHILANDENGIIGYWVFLPLEDDAYNQIITGSRKETELTIDDTPNILNPDSAYSGYLLLFGVHTVFKFDLDDVYNSWIKNITEQSSNRIFFKRIAVMLSTPSGKGFMRKKGMSESADYKGCAGGRILTYDFTHIGNIDYFKGKAEYEELVKNYTEFYKEEGSK